MDDIRCLRTIKDLEEVGSKWWPKEVREEAMKTSILQYLLDTQEKFISILILADSEDPSKLNDIIRASKFPYHLFLKHLILLTDIGSEPIQRIKSQMSELFPDNKLNFTCGDKVWEYEFTELISIGKPSNEKMQIDSLENLKAPCKNPGLTLELIHLLVYGAASTSPSTRSVLFKCNMFEYLGNEDKIKTFVKQNYIRVSKILGGRAANDLGNVAQSYAVSYFSQKLGKNYSVVSNGTIPGVQIEPGKNATFDLVFEKITDRRANKPYVGIELSFQETTNSTVERKGREAATRFNVACEKGSYVGYIIDGIGNFARTSAMTDLIHNSHISIAYTPEEFQKLIDFVKQML